MPKPLSVIGLIAQFHKPEVRETLHRFARELLLRDVELRVEEQLAAEVPQAVSGNLDFVLAADAVITLGGDGTLLAAARKAAPLGTPVLGVDLGSFGFLADQPPSLVLEHLDQLLAGHCELEERMMLQANPVVHQGPSDPTHGVALNDVVLTRKAHRRLIWIRCEVDGCHVATYPADGVIVSTPTGSTAYNLSAGGPIVDPRVECIVLTPICPHTLYTRPVVLEPSSQVYIRTEPRPGSASDDATLVLDGQEIRCVCVGEGALVRRAECKARFLRLGKPSFYDRLREKLNWDTRR
jgi:NAD+ kinase